MNNMFIIHAYRKGKTWMFDDKERQLIAEPFVLGASELIQKYMDRKGMKRRRKTTLLFSLESFPETDVVLICIQKCYPYTKEYNQVELTGSFRDVDAKSIPTSAYYTDQEGHQCWLCPAQLKFFDQVADTIYAKIG